MKNQVILFNSPWIKKKEDIVEEDNTHLRIGIASIAAYLKSNNIDVTIIDSNDINEIKEKIKEYNPDIVGFPAYTFEIFDSAETATIVKKIKPQVLVVVGGAHPSAMPKETLEEFPVFDVAVFGEGEQTLLEIAKGVEFKNIRGIAYRDSGQIIQNEKRELIEDLNFLPFPAWDLYDLKKYKDKRGENFLYLPVESARGCPFSCIFCYRIAGKIMRYKIPEKIVDEIENNIKKYNANKIYFVEGTFGVNKKHTIALYDEIIKRKITGKVSFEVSTRVDVIDKEILSKMKEVGVVDIGFGIESGDDFILKKVGKNTSREIITNAIKMCKDAGFKVGATFIIGHPYETKESILKTIKFAKKLPIVTANFAIMVPFPGTEVRKLAVDNVGGLRIRTNNWRLYGKQIGEAMELDTVPRDKLIKLQNKAYRDFYLTPKRWRYLLRHLTINRLLYAFKRLIGLD